PETGTVVPFAKGELSGEGKIGITLGARVWPPGPTIDFGIGLAVPGLASIVVTVTLDGGVFLEGEATIGANVALSTDACKGLESCVKVAAGYDFTPRIDVRLTAKSCVKTTCIFCIPTSTCVEASASLISAAWKFCGGLSYDSCASP